MQVPVLGTTLHVTGNTVLLALFALALVGFGAHDYYQQSAAIEDAAPVEATITHSEVVSDDSGRGGVDYYVDVEYTYRYRNTTYTDDSLTPGSFVPDYGSRDDAEAAIEPYEEGATVTAYVDPDEPETAFLERRRTEGPGAFAGIGGCLLVLTVLHAIGPRDVGRGTELHPESEVGPRPYETPLGVDRDAVNRWSKRVIAASVAALWASLFVAVGAEFAVGTVGEGTDLADATLALLVAAGVAYLALIASLLVYIVWSFTEYRRMRERIPEPRPPSPFILFIPSLYRCVGC